MKINLKLISNRVIDFSKTFVYTPVHRIGDMYTKIKKGL